MTAIDIKQIKREARRMSRTAAEGSYMQHLDAAARNLYGVRHYHEALMRHRRSDVPPVAVAPAWTHSQHYLHTLQEYYLGI